MHQNEATWHLIRRYVRLQVLTLFTMFVSIGATITSYFTNHPNLATVNFICAAMLIGLVLRQHSIVRELKRRVQ